MWELLPANVSRSLATDDGRPHPSSPIFVKSTAVKGTADEQLLAAGWKVASNESREDPVVIVVLARYGRKGFRPTGPLEREAPLMAQQLALEMKQQSVTVPLVFL